MDENTEKFALPYLYTLHTNGIHEIILPRPQKEVVTAWMKLMGTLYHDSPSDTPLRLCLDVRAEMPSLAYVVSEWSALNRQYPQRPPLRIAVLQRPDFLVSLLQSSLQLSVLTRNDRINYFGNMDRIKAMRWLVQGTQALEPNAGDAETVES